MDNKRAWIYCRVACDGPDSAELLAAQRKGLKAYAKEQGLEVVGTSYDMSTGFSMNRPGMMCFRAALETGKVDILLVHSLARLSRDMGEVRKYWEMLSDRGVSIHTLDWGCVDLSVDAMLYGEIGGMYQVGA